jgi:hypothetical protein
VCSGGVDAKLPGESVTLSGTVTNLAIDPTRLADGEFPVISVEEVRVQASGEIFGGKLEIEAARSLSIEGIIPANDLVSVAGKLILQVPEDASDPSDVELFGALQIDQNTDQAGGLAFLENVGLRPHADAQILLALNATPAVQELALALPGRDEETEEEVPPRSAVDDVVAGAAVNEVVAKRTRRAPDRWNPGAAAQSGPTPRSRCPAQ